jgi:hypothetical protein
LNIGCVVYKKDFATGKMNADWRLATNGKIVTGTGKATGIAGNEYSGKYNITYYNSKGIDAGSYELTITDLDNCYSLEWHQDGILKYVGIGMISDNFLIAGWTINSE